VVDATLRGDQIPFRAGDRLITSVVHDGDITGVSTIEGLGRPWRATRQK
jgi:hypothetical protein